MTEKTYPLITIKFMSDLLFKKVFGSHSVTILNLASKKINQTGATDLAEVLKVNSSIILSIYLKTK